MSRIEFGITPVRGYRKWDVRDGRLVGYHSNQVWPLRAPAQAVCQVCSRAGLPIPSGTRYGHFAGEGCGLYAWSAPEFVERHYTLLSKRLKCWGVVEGWGRVVEHKKAFVPCTCARWPCRPCSRSTSSSPGPWPPPTRSRSYFGVLA